MKTCLGIKKIDLRGQFPKYHFISIAFDGNNLLLVEKCSEEISVSKEKHYEMDSGQAHW